MNATGFIALLFPFLLFGDNGLSPQPAPQMAPELSALKDAINAKDAGAVEAALKKAKVNGVFTSGDSPLQEAVKTGSLPIVQLLVKKGAKINYQNLLKNTALHLSWQNRDIFRYLLQQGGDPNLGNHAGDTPLFTVVRWKNPSALEDLELLKKKGANLNVKSVSGNTALYEAMLFENYDHATWLLKNGADPNPHNNTGSGPVQMAFRWDNEELIRLMAAHGGNFKSRFAKGKTVLHFAAEGLKAATALPRAWEYFKEINAQDDTGNTALHAAAASRDKEAVAFLLEKGADPKIKNKSGKTPSELTGAGRADILTLLGKAGSPMVFLDANGVSLLHIMIGMGDLPGLKALLAKGAPPNDKDKRGDSPLIKTILSSNANAMEMARLLLEYKADPNLKSGSGKSPLELAKSLGRTGIAGLIAAKGGK